MALIFSNCQKVASWITGFEKISVPLATDLLILTFSCSRVCSTILSLRCLQCQQLSVILREFALFMDFVVSTLPDKSS